MKYLSVCSGIEAATTAWHQLGWKPVAFSEIEPFPSAVLAHHWPDVPNLGDMTKYHDWRTDDIQLLVGGTPCQAFSVAGLRKGLDDPRGNLTLTFLGILARYRPKWVVWENVPGVLSDKTGAFGSFLGGLSELGYGWAYRILDAQHFGVPQRRRRVFVVGCLGDWASAAAVLFESESLCWNPPKGKKTRKVAPSSPSRSTAGGDLGTDFDCEGGLIAKCLTTGTGKRLDFETEDFVMYPLKVEGFDAYNNEVTGKLSKTIDTGQDYHHVPNVFQESLGMNIRRLTPKECERQPHVLAAAFKYTMGAKANGIGYAEEQSPTLDTKPDSNAVVLGMQVRRLTPRECERLQGFPDDHTLIPWRGKPADQCPDGPRYKALGNSMAVPVMRWIGERLQRINSMLD